MNPTKTTAPLRFFSIRAETSDGRDGRLYVWDCEANKMLANNFIVNEFETQLVNFLESLERTCVSDGKFVLH
jgi:hypothetical protein